MSALTVADMCFASSHRPGRSRWVPSPALAAADSACNTLKPGPPSSRLVADAPEPEGRPGLAMHPRICPVLWGTAGPARCCPQWRGSRKLQKQPAAIGNAARLPNEQGSGRQANNRCAHTPRSSGRRQGDQGFCGQARGSKGCAAAVGVASSSAEMAGFTVSCAGRRGCGNHRNNGHPPNRAPARSSGRRSAPCPPSRKQG